MFLNISHDYWDNVKINSYETMNAARFNNRVDSPTFSFILKVPVFSEACLESIRISTVKLFAKLAENRSLFLQKSLVINA